jgi:hypothetical protein
VDTTSPYTWSINTLTLSNGAHQLVLYALDSSGATATAQINITVSNQVINVAFTTPTAAQSLSGTVSVSASASSGASLSSVVLKLDGAILGTKTTIPYTWSLDTSAYADGSHILNLTATDSLGRIAYAQIQVTFSNSGPQVAITTPADGAAVSGTVSVSATVTSTRAISYVVFLLDGIVVGNRTAAPYTWAFSTGTMGDGAHSITIRAVDNIARIGQRSIQVTVQNPLPTVSISSPGDGANIKGTVTVSGNASSAQGIAFVEFYVDGVKMGNRTAAPFSWALVTTTLSDGQHLIELRARSQLGLSASAQVTVVVQNSATQVAIPSITISSPTAGQSLHGSFTLTASITSTDPLLYITLRIGDTLFDMRSGPPYSWGIDSNLLSDGQHVLVVTAVTTKGGMGVKSVSVTVANPAPTFSIQGVQEGSILTGAVVLSMNATSSNAISEMYIWVDGGLLGLFDTGSGRMTLDTNTLANGQHYLNAAAKDAYGKEGGLEIAFQVRNDAPLVSIAAPGDGTRAFGALDIQVLVNCSRSTQVSLKIDDLILGTAVSPPYWFRVDSDLLTSGTHVITASATDAYGKSGQAQISIVVDNAPPTVALPNLRGSILSGKVLLVPEVNAPNGVKNLVLKVDNIEVYSATLAPFQYSLDTNLLSNDMHHILLELTDRNGKSCELDLIVEVSNLPPTVTVQASGMALYGSVEITATIAGGASPVQAWVEVDGTYLSALSAQGQFTIDTRQLSDGEHVLKVIAEDAYARRGLAEMTITVANDGPTVSILTPTAQGDGATNSVLALQIASPWPITNVQVWLDAKSLGTLGSSPWNMPLDVASLSNGEHRLNVTVMDAHGNAGQAEVTFTVTNSGPTVSILTPTADGEIIMNSTIALQITGPWPIANASAWVDGDLLGELSVEPWTFPLRINTLAEGAHTLKVSVTDARGGVGNATISFASRIVAPQLALGEPTGSSGSVDVPLTTNMPLLYVVYYLDGVELSNGSVSPFTCSIDTSVYADGLHVLNATAVLTDGTALQTTKEMQFLNSAKAPGVGFVLDFKDLDLIFLQALIIVLVLAVALGKVSRKRKQ